mgnify:CR=1 FL=1
MAHFAEVTDGTVTRVVVVSNTVTTIDGVEDEQRGVDFLDGLLPTGGAWVQTSYNSSFRHNMAGCGGTWDGTGFASAQRYPSWSLDENYQWQPPTPYPDTDDLAAYGWDEDTTSWVEITE